jgi:hypothetical protein
MNQPAHQSPSLSAAVAGSFVVAGLLVMGALGWIVRERAISPTGYGPRTAEASSHKPAPQPPAKPAWISPLQHSCSGQDFAQRQRLQTLLATLRSSPKRVPADPTNFGERFRRDAFGNPVDPTPRLVVLHETVYGLSSAIHTFTTAHPNDEDQVSYHALIGDDGTVVQLIDPSKRAFGAGNSAFNGQWVVTNPKVGGSVNNFALHVSLETPLDGENDNAGHSGYSSAQYDSLAVLLADWMERFPITLETITTHRAVDLGGERSDPRSFNWQALQERLQNLGLLC